MKAGWRRAAWGQSCSALCCTSHSCCTRLHSCCCCLQVVKRGEHTFQMGIHCAFCRQAKRRGAPSCNAAKCWRLVLYVHAQRDSLNPPRLQLMYGQSASNSIVPPPPTLLRHDRRKQIVLHPLHFQGTRSTVVWLEPELRRRGMLPGPLDPEHGMLPGPLDPEHGMLHAPVRAERWRAGCTWVDDVEHAACGCGACMLHGLCMTHTCSESWHLRFASCPAHILAGRHQQGGWGAGQRKQQQ